MTTSKIISCSLSATSPTKTAFLHYRTSGGLYQVTFPKQAVTYDDVTGQCRLATSKENKLELLDPVLTINGEKPLGYKFSGRRVKRGLYRSAKGILVNADLNGAGSILRKVAIQLGISLAEVGRAALTLPKRYNVHLMRRSYRKNGETCLQTVSE